MRPPIEVIPQAVQQALDRLSTGGIANDFYLAGGTALALHLQHRRSVDLDFFSRTNRLDFAGRQALLGRLRALSGWSIDEAIDGTLRGRLARVRVTFFWYPEPLIKPLVRHGRIRLASLEDIGLMKLAAIVGRGSKKDFVDMYVVCQRISLDKLLALSRRKFRDINDFPLQALKALVFFEDAEQNPSVVSPTPFDWKTIKAFFVREARARASEYIPGLSRS